MKHCTSYFSGKQVKHRPAGLLLRLCFTTLLAGAVVILAGGCRQGDAATGDSLFLYCGAGLREPAARLIEAFEAETGINIMPTYTGSGCLLAQISLSHSGDLYMPGEDWYMDQAEERGYIERSSIVAYFTPVIMVHRGNPHNILTLKDMLKPGVRIGMGEPKACAIGSFTLKVLEANDIDYEEFRKNVVAHFATAPELGTGVKLQAVDAAVQWDSLAALYIDECDVVPFPVDESTVSPVPLGVLKFSKNKEAAERFLQFVEGPRGQEIFRKHHYTLDPANPTFPPGRVWSDIPGNVTDEANN